MRLSGWGGYPVAESRLETPGTTSEVVACIRSGKPLIARGNGRAYGDAAIGASITMSMLKLNNIISFDENTGELVCEAGVLLRDVLDAFVPLGWFPPVTPGTKFVTLGGMIACDVHGRNHREVGSFGRHVLWLDLVLADGAVVRCSPSENSDAFTSTIGGMGLTGVILRCCLRLVRIKSAYIHQRSIVANNLSEILSAFERSTDSTYSVAWIDCLASGDRLGRSVLYLGEHAKADEVSVRDRAAPLRLRGKRSISIPFELPVTPLNYATVWAFNECYYRMAKLKPAERILDYDAYCYPLDSILHWNRLYGRRGFVQYQCVLPFETSRQGLTELLQTISESKSGSFLGVLKLFGRHAGALSFPLYGYTLALDFPWSAKTAALLNRLDQIVLRHRGRLYLAKDARLSRDAFEGMQANLDRFRQQRSTNRLAQVFHSHQSQRLGL